MKFRYLFYSLLGVVGLASCDLTGNINDIKPQNQLDESTLIRDANSANLALRGVYEMWRAGGLSMITPNMGLLSDALTAGGTISDASVFSQNAVKPETNTIASYYTALYAIVNYAGLVGEQLEAGKAVGLDSVSTVRMTGECRFQRAMADFYLLRAYGQFYDKSSPYGIVIVKEHMRDNKAVARSTVEESYRFIHEDLDDAIKMIPDDYITGHYNASHLTAKALKAKVLLYEKRYKEAADLAKEVLDEAEAHGYVLETEYADIFKHGHLSSEALFAPYAWGFKERLITNISRTKSGLYSRKVADAMVGGSNDGNTITGEGFDERYAITFATALAGPNNNGKYPYRDNSADLQSNSYFYLRLAEIYLIHAEAAIRGYDDYAGARASLKKITDRAGYDADYVNTIADGDMLQLIREHKLLELVAEAYEEWFDLVRYHKEGDLNISDIKPTIASDSQLIFPMPQTALAGNNLLEQNPL